MKRILLIPLIALLGCQPASKLSPPSTAQQKEVQPEAVVGADNRFELRKVTLVVPKLTLVLEVISSPGDDLVKISDDQGNVGYFRNRLVHATNPISEPSNEAEFQSRMDRISKISEVKRVADQYMIGDIYNFGGIVESQIKVVASGLFSVDSLSGYPSVIQIDRASLRYEIKFQEKARACLSPVIFDSGDQALEAFLCSKLDYLLPIDRKEVDLFVNGVNIPKYESELRVTIRAHLVFLLHAQKASATFASLHSKHAKLFNELHKSYESVRWNNSFKLVPVLEFLEKLTKKNNSDLQSETEILSKSVSALCEKVQFIWSSTGKRSPAKLEIQLLEPEVRQFDEDYRLWSLAFQEKFKKYKKESGK